MCTAGGGRSSSSKVVVALCNGAEGNAANKAAEPNQTITERWVELKSQVNESACPKYR